MSIEHCMRGYSFSGETFTLPYRNEPMSELNNSYITLGFFCFVDEEPWS